MPFDRIPFDHQHCFLCGVALTGSTATQEHIFPKWLQSRFSLWDEQLTLLNGTDIPYRQLTVPCSLQNWGESAAGFWSRNTGVGTAIFEREGHVALCDPEMNVVGIAPYEDGGGAQQEPA